MAGSSLFAPADEGISAADVELQAASSFTPNFTLLASPYTGISIGGSGRVFGTEFPEPIFVRDLPGTIVFDASFNRGGDEVFLPKDASEWTVFQDGSTAHLSDGDTTVVMPVGPKGLALGFDDGIRFLKYDSNGDMKIGSQILEGVPAPISSPPIDGGYLGIDTPMQGPSVLFVSPGDPISAYSGTGPLIIFGTAGEEHLVLRGGTVQLDASFNRGGDTVTFELSASDITVEIDGSLARFHTTVEGRFLDATIPIGITGIELKFDEGTAILKYDLVSSSYTIDQQIITGDPTVLSIFG